MQLFAERSSPGAALDQFARRLIRSRTVWTVSTPKGLARLPSRTTAGRQVNLMWTTREVAEPWLRCFEQSRLNLVWLPDFLRDILPKLHQLDRLVGCDWPAPALQAEMPPQRLKESLRRATLSAFIKHVQIQGKVWMLEDDAGPAFAASQETPGRLVLPCWSAWAAADSKCKGFWQEMTICAVETDRFVDRTLRWLQDIGRGVSLDHGLAVPVEVGPPELEARLGGPPARRSCRG